MSAPPAPIPPTLRRALGPLPHYLGICRVRVRATREQSPEIPVDLTDHGHDTYGETYQADEDNAYRLSRLRLCLAKARRRQRRRLPRRRVEEGSSEGADESVLLGQNVGTVRAIRLGALLVDWENKTEE